MKQRLGFTLIELMIAVAVVGILAAIAYPSYQAYLLKSRRTIATGALTEIASKEEAFRFRNRSYTTNLANLGYTVSDGSVHFPGGTDNYYTVTVPTDEGCSIASCYILAAVPVNAQANDQWHFRLWSTGLKQSSQDGSTWQASWPK